MVGAHHRVPHEIRRGLPRPTFVLHLRRLELRRLFKDVVKIAPRLRLLSPLMLLSLLLLICVRGGKKLETDRGVKEKGRENVNRLLSGHTHRLTTLPLCAPCSSGSRCGWPPLPVSAPLRCSCLPLPFFVHSCMYQSCVEKKSVSGGELGQSTLRAVWLLL